MSKYENHALSTKILPFIFNENTVRGNGLRFGASNWHENVEILCVTDGEGAASSNGKIIPLKKGDTVIFNKNYLHATATSKSLTYRYLIVDRTFCIENDFDTNKIQFKSKIDDEGIVRLMDELYDLYHLPDSTPYRVLAIRSTVLSLMLLLCKNYSCKSTDIERSDSVAGHIKKAIEIINDTFTRDISLDDVADKIGVSKYYLSHEFNKYVGYSFVSYINCIRCNKAQELLLETSLPITEISTLCGFRSTSYFAKIFKRLVGILPRSYRIAGLKTS